MEIIFIDNYKNFLTPFEVYAEKEYQQQDFQFFYTFSEGAEYVIKNSAKIAVLVIDYDLIERYQGWSNGLDFCNSISKIYKILMTNKNLNEIEIKSALKSGQINAYFSKYDENLSVFKVFAEIEKGMLQFR